MLKEDFGTFSKDELNKVDATFAKAAKLLNKPRTEITFVGIHVRRGDYVKPAMAKAGFLEPGMDFLKRALDSIRSGMYLFAESSKTLKYYPITDSPLFYWEARDLYGTSAPQAVVCNRFFWRHVEKFFFSFSWLFNLF